MAAAIASTRTESSKIDSAGVESGAKMLVGLIANGPTWRTCCVLPLAQPVPGSIRRHFVSERRIRSTPQPPEPARIAGLQTSAIRDPGARVAIPAAAESQGAFAVCV